MMILDMTGKPCPIPVIEAKKAFKAALPGGTVSLLVDNDVARQNLQKMAEGLGHEFKYEPQADGNILAAIKITDGCQLAAGDGGGLVVAIGHDCMGGPSEELGKSLLKSFIYSLTELDDPPEHILFYNGGVRLAVEGAGTLDDLAALAEKGSQVSSCGACLNYYQLTDRLAIGRVTNMYAIVSAMGQAKRLINI